MMMKKSILLSMFLLASTAVNANISSIAVSKMAIESNEEVLAFTLNNQGNDTIQADSALLPEQAKKVAAQGAVIFNVAKPQQIGIQRIRYSNGELGCDFYLDTQNGPMQGMLTTYITGVPISAASMCNVYTTGSVNHLAVSFFKMNNP